MNFGGSFFKDLKLNTSINSIQSKLKEVSQVQFFLGFFLWKISIVLKCLKHLLSEFNIPVVSDSCFLARGRRSWHHVGIGESSAEHTGYIGPKQESEFECESKWCDGSDAPGLAQHESKHVPAAVCPAVSTAATTVRWPAAANGRSWTILG